MAYGRNARQIVESEEKQLQSTSTAWPAVSCDNLQGCEQCRATRPDSNMYLCNIKQQSKLTPTGTSTANQGDSSLARSNDVVLQNKGLQEEAYRQLVE